jgi:hypothetical protein
VQAYASRKGRNRYNAECIQYHANNQQLKLPPASRMPCAVGGYLEEANRTSVTCTSGNGSAPVGSCAKLWRSSQVRHRVCCS